MRALRYTYEAQKLNSITKDTVFLSTTAQSGTRIVQLRGEIVSK